MKLLEKYSSLNTLSIDFSGTFTGRIVRPAAPQSPENKREDGMIRFSDGESELRAFFGHHNVCSLYIDSI